jgi:hypothetical protein
LGGGIVDRFGAMALDEATRPVTVREGDKVSEIPAMQALLRTMFRAAAQGDTKAGRQLLEVIARAESGRTGATLEILEHAIQYKEKYDPIFEQPSERALILWISSPTRTMSSSMKLRVKSQLTGRSARNRPAREKLFDSNQLNRCGGISR